MIPLTVPDLSGNEAAYLQRCIESTFVSSIGEFVTDFEAAVAEASGAVAGVATSAGTTALHLALATLRVGRGDLVILPDYTFIASANAISMAGARPWFMDICRDSWTLDPVMLEAALDDQTVERDGVCVHRETGERVAAIMPVHTLGHPADMDAIRIIAQRHSLPIIADAAAALGARYKGRPIGNLADISCLSFNGNKTITSGGGGMILCNDKSLIARAQHLNSTARLGTNYLHDEAAFNYRMTNIQAAVGLAQIERLEEFLAAKRRIARAYREALSDAKGVTFFPEAEWAESAHWFSGIVLEDGDRVNEIVADLTKAEIQARAFWLPMHVQPPYKDCPRGGSLSIASDVAPRVLTLPCSTNLSSGDQARVIEVLRGLII